MAHMNQRETAAGRKHRWLRYAAAAITATATGLLLLSLGLQLVREVRSLQAAPSDSMQWALAQVQVELLVLTQTVDGAIDAYNHEQVLHADSSLADVRQRFDIFYSRVATLRQGEVFVRLTDQPRAMKALGNIQATLAAALPVIDADDATLEAALPDLFRQFSAIQTDVRRLMLEGIRVLATNADAQRQSFSVLLIETSIVTAIVLVAMVVALLLLVFQARISRRRSEALRVSNELYSSAVGVSLDPILVTAEDGRILDCNAAAERVFGFHRENVLGRKVEDLIIPPERRRMHLDSRAQYLAENGQHSHVSERLEIEAQRIDGARFPAEISFGFTRGSDGAIFTVYIRDISDRKKMQETLTAARDEAIATARAKSEFLAVMSHEMRTPLNGVIGVLDMLGETRLTAKQKSYLQTALTSGEILQRRINEVLDITRLEAGAATLNPAGFSVSRLLNELQRISTPEAAKSGNQIVVDIADGIEDFVQDRHYLRQVLINLIGNAVKFTENGTITLRARGDENGIDFSVVDTGIGISSADQQRIFDDFVMLDSSYGRKVAGSGLGLGIARRIATLMGGTLSVESNLGQGSVFTLSLPPLAEPDLQAEHENEIVAQTTPNRAQFALDILLVEDNETNRFIAREMLRRHGCRIVEAVDGQQGVEAAAARRFDIIFMDVSMPRLDGIRATEIIRSGDGASQQSVIIGLTAHALPEERQRMLEAGMQDCIFKPLRAARLAGVLAQYAGKSGKTQPESSAISAESHELFDHETFRELAAALPPALFSRQMERFRQELTNVLDDQLAEGRTLPQWADAAHKLAGSAAVFGARKLRRALQALEMACKADDRSDLQNLREAVSCAANETLQALKTAPPRTG
ncbi:response regulator [Martelella alba]|uniref:histidine kinase n=1 Tax=Martelella alba TaxID=2590451 RepID=A0A506U7M8_9HYPH|nr:ATP-binding protein [Martelella alba]TPW29111.1 response regulator [Martelella alba]